MTLDAPHRNRLARAVQAGVPLVPRPFARIGAELGLDEAQVLGQLRDWAADGTLREISAVVEGSAVGYESALVAAQVPERHLERAVAVVNAHPTVTHNYLRDHDYNLWFTLAVPRAMGLEPTARLLAAEAGLPVCHLARRTETYKIGVNFDLESMQNRTTPTGAGEVPETALDARECDLVRALQTPLPLTEAPFEALAQDRGVDEASLLAFGRGHLGGLLRRYAATLRHRRVGVRSNAMVVWNVPEARRRAVGEMLAAAPEVSHCYARTPLPGFPYTVYSMLHAPDAEVLHETLRRLADEVAVPDHRPLVSLREFKKVRLRYFLPELSAWWSQRTRTELAS